MPKVKFPSTKPATKSRLPKKASLTGARGSPPATDILGDVNCTDLLNDTSEMLHRDDDMCAPFLGFKSEEVLLERRKLSLQLGITAEHRRKCETPLKSLTSLPSEASRSNDVVSTKKKRKAEGATSSSSKGKGRKVVQDEPSLKKKKVNDEALADDDEDVAIDTNAMQTRIRTGTISKSTLAHLSGDVEVSDYESNGSRPMSPNWEEQEDEIVAISKTPSSKGGGGKCRRRGRCMECPNCLKKDDCGQCANCLDKPKFGGPNTRKQACIHRKCYNLMIRQRKSADSTPKQSKRQPRPQTDEAGPVQTRPHPSAMNKALLHRKTTRRIKGKSAVQLRWQHISSDGMAVYWRRGQQSHVIPLCAHCGSGGMSELMRCQVCCVPYHWYCLKDYCRDDDRKNFICASCICCAVCGGGDHLWLCCKCKKYYHSDCLPGQEITPNRSNRLTWQCISCSKCCSCGNDCPADTYSHTPNIINSGSDTCSPTHHTEANKQSTHQFCSPCYKLFSEGNYCPICFVCYSDNDYDSKMVQCGKCDHWIHSHCENMTDEEYEVLSELPEDSVIYLCRLCSDDKGWREAILSHCSGVFQQIMVNLQELSTAKVLFQSHVMERGEARLHDKGFINNNGYSTSQSSMTLLMERVANGYYKTVESFSDGLLLAMMTLLHQQSDQLLYKAVINTWSHFTELMKQHFSWYQVKDITNLSEVSCVLTKESAASYHDNSITGADSDEGREQWLATFPTEHNYYKKRPAVLAESSCDLWCDNTTDLRKCLLCNKCGDHSEKSAGRLIPCGIGEWVHVNCALWSAEVYEEQSGMMYDVHSAISRGSRVRCDVCHELGATIGCCASRCSRSFHFLCALSAECVFLANKNLFCPEHSLSCEDQPKATEEQLQVSRCVVVDMLPERHYVRLVESIDPEQISTQIGCTLVHEAGEIVPQSETLSCLLPSKYRCSFQFWDVNNPVAMTTYTLTVQYNEEAPTVYLSSWTNPSQPPGGDVDNPLIDYESITIGGPSPEVHPERLPVGIDRVISQVDSQIQQLLEAQLVGGAVEGLMSLAGECNVLDHIKEFHMPKIIDVNADVTASPVATPATELKSPCLERLQVQQSATPIVMGLHLTSSSGLSMYSSSVPELWENLVSKLQQRRLNVGLERFHLDNISPFKLFGLSLEPVVRIIEQLPDAENCTLYQFKHHPPSKLSSWYDARKRETINQTGCARSEPYRGRQPWDMFNFLMSEYRPKPPEVNHEDLALAEQEGMISHKQVYSAASTLPMAMRYRNLRKKVKQTVGVYKSSIHGMGLFCKQSIDPAEMVIEYAGTVIRSVLTDKREKYYNSKNIGCYMFRIDEHEVVDATMSGNAARFINHSCEPNCYSKIITVDGRKKIIIFARRRIVPGEELTYDYKFPIEDASAKIPCNCGAPHCRGAMN